MPQVLIVDDDPSIRALLSKALSNMAEIHTATGWMDAMKALSVKRYDTILLDLHMPGVGGLALLDILSKKPGPNRETPVFVITADTTEGARAQALARNATYFLTKPLSIMTLRNLVEGVLKKHAFKGDPPSTGGSGH